VSDVVIFSGCANEPLAAAIAGQFGTPLGQRTIRRFADGEVSISIDESVRRREVYIVQPTAPPVDQNLLELLAFADACRRASADRIVAVLPYFGYARSDKRLNRREPIAASMVADLLQAVGITQVITLDIHAPQIEGFFRIPFDNLSAVPLLTEAVRGVLPGPIAVVSPDAGRVRAASEFARRLRAPLVVMHKRRETDVETEVTHIVGEVRGRACLIIDDMISTGGTIAESASALRRAGADREIVVAATHGLFRDGAREKLRDLDLIVVTDSVAQTGDDWPNRRTISVAPLIANAIQRIAADGSLGWVDQT
jgi:ribose-phosphate pyrophosphokinase